MAMKQHVPNVLDVLASISSPEIKGDGEKQIPPLCTSYGILMNSRWKELSLIQKVNGIILGVGGATEKVLLIIVIEYSPAKSINYNWTGFK